MDSIELRTFIIKHDLTAYRLARLLGVSGPAVSHWTVGRGHMSRQSVMQIKYLEYCLEHAPKKFWKEGER